MSQTHVSFIFDDGFTKSCLQVAEIFEARNLSATFAVLVDHEGFMPDFPKGDFKLWNELLERGHEIHPHGWDHSDLSQIPFDEATQKIDDCLNYFTENVTGFQAASTVYHLTYNRSTPEVDAYLLERVKAIRTTGPEGEPGDGLSTADSLSSRQFGCAWQGPDHCDGHLRASLKTAASSDAKHFCYMLHGLDDEGWGPIHRDALEDILDSIQNSDQLVYTPIGEFVGQHLNAITDA
ncbi:MAG: polysaccharide deacetylase family protein [Verrucomicrobiota bacterium]